MIKLKDILNENKQIQTEGIDALMIGMLAISSSWLWIGGLLAVVDSTRKKKLEKLIQRLPGISPKDVAKANDLSHWLERTDESKNAIKTKDANGLKREITRQQKLWKDRRQEKDTFNRTHTSRPSKPLTDTELYNIGSHL